MLMMIDWVMLRAERELAEHETLDVLTFHSSFSSCCCCGTVRRVDPFGIFGVWWLRTLALAKGVMSAVRRKKPEISFGWPSGAFGSYPSKDQHDLLDFVAGATKSSQSWIGKDLKEDKAKAVKNGTGSICVDDRVGDAGSEGLTEKDTQDIVRRVREFLEKQGPSQESELLDVLPPQLVRRLRASFDNLAALVERLPGFHHVCEDRYSFLYYLSPEEDDGCCSAPPDLPLEHGSTVAKGGGSSNLYEGAAKQGEVRDKRDACSQTPSSKREELECEVKERAREVAELEQRLEAVRLDQARKRQALRLKIEQHRTLQVTLPPMPSFCEEDDEEGDKRSSVEEVGEGLPLHDRALLHDKYVEAECSDAGEEEPQVDPEPKYTTAVVKQEHKMSAVLRAPVPDFYDLHMQLERSNSSSAESLWSSWGGDSPTKTKAEAQIAKIVKMLIKKQPFYTEFEMRRWVDEVRRLQGGFSRMTLNTIVSLVLDHMKKRGLRLRKQ